MSAARKSSFVLLCLSLAVVALLGVFDILDASFANASQASSPQVQGNTPQSIGVDPGELTATLQAGENQTQTLWLTNLDVSPITFTIYEISGSIFPVHSLWQPVSVPRVDVELRSQIESHGSARAIILLREIPDLSPAYLVAGKTLRAEYVYNRLLEVASHSQELFAWLEAHDAQPQRLLSAGAIVARLDGEMLEQVATDPQVKQIVPNGQRVVIAAEAPLFLPPPPSGARASQPSTVEWNIAKVRANEAWTDLGITGEGAAVGIIDTGVAYAHPALVNSYRGNLGDTFEHDYNWFDEVAGLDEPYDDNGHGSMGAGFVTGDDGGGNQIGVAPGADWIAVKACTGGGSCSDADLLAALDWMLAPTDLSGDNPDPSRAPDVVLGMWGGDDCNTFFQLSLMALRAANILPVFAPGGTGPDCGTVGSPAALPEAVTAGATDEQDLIAPFSARGPGCYGIIKPDLSAPGVEVRTSDGASGYVTTSGTSWSTAHVAGAAAMVISANPALSVDGMTEILTTSAVCIEDLSCGGEPCPGANNVYGHGRIDVFEAVLLALGAPPFTDLPWLSETPVTGTLPGGENVGVEVTFDAVGLQPGVFTGGLVVQSSALVDDLVFVPITLTVTEACQPITDLSIGVTPLPPFVGEVITFTASAIGTPPIQYTWNFGDSSSGVGQVVTHVYENQGIYTIALTADNGCGAPVMTWYGLRLNQRHWFPLALK